MNYYIDFDETLFDTYALVDRCKEVLCDFANSKEIIYSYYDNTLKDDSIIQKLDKIILNCSDLVYKDSIHFLEKIKSKNNSLYLLSYTKFSFRFQNLKIIGSGLYKYFDALFITDKPKYNLGINYKNGIFIDDNPTDLLGLYSKNPIEVIRIRREGAKYSVRNTDNSNIKEYKDFNELLKDYKFEGND